MVKNALRRPRERVTIICLCVSQFIVGYLYIIYIYATTGNTYSPSTGSPDCVALSVGRFSTGCSKETNTHNAAISMHDTAHTGATQAMTHEHLRSQYEDHDVSEVHHAQHRLRRYQQQTSNSKLQSISLIEVNNWTPPSVH